MEDGRWRRESAKGPIIINRPGNKQSRKNKRICPLAPSMANCCFGKFLPFLPFHSVQWKVWGFGGFGDDKWISEKPEALQTLCFFIPSGAGT
jgi:hypothetical protein